MVTGDAMTWFGALQRFKLQVAVDRRQRKREGSSGPASEVRKVEVTPELEQAALQALGKRRGTTLTWRELRGGRSGPWR
jgi:hypothetical protein